MSLISRAGVIAGLGAFALGAGCARHEAPGVTMGSKNFTESVLLGEMYAQVLERAGIPVTRKLNLGGTQIAMEALRRGEIDCYPEYTGTALLDVLHYTPMHDAHAIYETVAHAYEKNFKLTWLQPSQFNDSQGLACTRATSAKYAIQTLSQLAAAAPQLRLGAIAEFVNRPDALPGLQKKYGGFQFKEVKLLENGLKYRALLSGFVDVVVAFTTEGQIAAENLWVFVDDKHFWPIYQAAPVVRNEVLQAQPKLADSLNALAPLLTDGVMRSLNWSVQGPQKQQPADVAQAFLRSHGLG